MTYQLTAFGSIIRLTDNAFIPQDEANTDFITYKAWLDAGNTPEPAPIIEPPVPLTTEQKLAASGLTVDELKELLGLS